MMWRTFNWLFGWDYAAVRTCGRNVEICRVIQSGAGPAAIVYGEPRFLKPGGQFDNGDYCTHWWPLTWKDATTPRRPST